MASIGTPAQTARIANAVLDPYPFWKTKAFIGGIVMFAAFVLEKTGWMAALTPADQDWIADVIVWALGGGGTLTVLIGRWTQKMAPPVKAL